MLLEIDQLVASYGRVRALNGLSLTVGEGEIVTLLGANGAGKSTVLRTLSGLLHPQEGRILFRGQPIGGKSPKSIVELGIAHVPERRRVFPGLTSRENILLGGSNLKGVSRADLERDADEKFDIFPEIRPFAHTLGWKLSGGQQQMVAVARGLMARPKLLLLDEPSLGLAPLIVQQVYRVISEIKRRGTTVLLVEQNAQMAPSVADRGYVIETGSIVAEGPPRSLLDTDEIKAAYLGKSARV
jgi:branched-chain amino acid transport system ATP-binding protein